MWTDPNERRAVISRLLSIPSCLPVSFCDSYSYEIRVCESRLGGLVGLYIGGRASLVRPTSLLPNVQITSPSASSEPFPTRTGLLRKPYLPHEVIKSPYLTLPRDLSESSFRCQKHVPSYSDCSIRGWMYLFSVSLSMRSFCLVKWI